MALVPKEYRLSTTFNFLDSRKKEDVEIYETYMKYKKINGDKSNPNTIRDLIMALGKFIGLYEKRVLVSIKHTEDGYEVEKVIDTSIVKDKEG